MKKNKYIVFIFAFSLLLSACSLREDAADLYEKEKPLEVDVIIPESFADNKQETIQAVLTQDGKKVKNAEYVHFEIWKQDGSLTYNMEEAEEKGNGLYTISKDFDSNGLYYVKVHASNAGSTIMPQKQFIVGDLSKSELEFLQKDLPEQNENHEHHH